jgi:formamidopyrimidine-DNA glycosylase
VHDVLHRCRREGVTHVILDGTLIASDRLAGVRDNGNDLWFRQKHKAFGGSSARCRRCGEPVTLPVATSRAANKVVVPCRT